MTDNTDDTTRDEAIERLEAALSATRATCYDVAHGNAYEALQALEELRGESDE